MLPDYGVLMGFGGAGMMPEEWGGFGYWEEERSAWCMLFCHIQHLAVPQREDQRLEWRNLGGLTLWSCVEKGMHLMV